MTVKSILDQKGRIVTTLNPGDTIAAAAKILADRKIGAAVVVRDGNKIAGILSERDIVRLVASGGAAALAKPVSSAMTAKVKTCAEDNTVNDVMTIMTEGRFRHLPVETNGKLAGIISIGDVVKRRIDEAIREAEQIRAYIATA
ncbi:MAG: CBS domain-containing protein [Rhizobiaceae bacterium]